MSLVSRLARWLPSGRLRDYCRNFIETELRGYPQAAVKYRTSELSLNLDMVLSHYRVSHSLIRYVQVGAFDGVSDDPIYPLIEKHALQGILIEPQRDAFERLKANYAHFDPTAYVLVNAAIAARDGTAALYTIKPESQGPDWLRQIASFDRSVVMKHAPVVPNLESFIQSEEVRCMTFTTLFKEVGNHHIDLLQVDAEGYDAEILRLFDIPSRKPAIVHFEHKHLSLADHERSIGALVDVGYRFHDLR